jgi:aryl-alcohol dehydrogenase-like predicted oxidoreductase
MAFDRNWRYISRFATPEGSAVIEQLTAFALDRDHTLPQLAIAWLQAEPTVATVLSGASTVEQAIANFSGPAWELSVDDLAEVRLILEGNPQA